VTDRPLAAVVVVGSEILEDGRFDTNGPFIEKSLGLAGFRPILRLVVGDDREAIAFAVREASARASIVVVSGGLGPTFDDLSREGTADALGTTLARSPELESALRERLRRRGMTPPESVYRMADVVPGAEILANSVGAAPGLLVKGPPSIALVPGVPAEMEAMLLSEVLPRLQALHPGAPSLRRIFKIAGLYESEVEGLLSPAMPRWGDLGRTILASPGEITFILRGDPGDGERLESARADVLRILGGAIYSESDEGLECAVGRLLASSSMTLATAESCTGGMLGGMITSVPGSSSYYLGGAISYADDVKGRLLDVPAETIARHGAVSAETAAAMALGALERTGADLSLAVTGVAGPGGGSAAKPVGLVHLALGRPSGAIGRELRLTGDRGMVRLRACRAALDLLRREVFGSRREERA